MKHTKKLLAALLAALMVFGLTSCGSVGKWIAKTDSIEVPVGAYLLNEGMYYQYSVYYVSDSSKSPLKQEIKVDDNTTQTGAEWVQSNAMTAVKNMVAVLSECQKLNITLTDDEAAAIKENVDTTWDSSSATYEKIGIAKSSVRFIYEFNKLNEKLFDAKYGPNGSSAVKDSELKSYFEEKYTSVEYFTVSLKGSDGKALSDDEQAKIKTELEKLGDQYSSGTSFDDVTAAYNKAHSDATVTANSRIAIASNVFSTDVVKAIDDCKEGKATVVSTSNYMYLIAKHKIADETADYLKENATTLRHELKDSDYKADLEEAAKALTITENDAAVKKYSARWIEKNIK